MRLRLFRVGETEAGRKEEVAVDPPWAGSEGPGEVLRRQQGH